MIGVADFRRRADPIADQGDDVTADVVRDAADEIEVSRRYTIQAARCD